MDMSNFGHQGRALVNDFLVMWGQMFQDRIYIYKDGDAVNSYFLRNKKYISFLF